MSQDVQHSPLPWTRNGRWIESESGQVTVAQFSGDIFPCSLEAFANSELILHCVNSHHLLVEALEGMMSELRWLRDNRPVEYDALVAASPRVVEYANAWDGTKAALETAKDLGTVLGVS